MSHFSTVKTELRQLAPLRGALEDLGYTPGDSQQTVRGYKGQTVEAELAVAVDGGALVAGRLLLRRLIPVRRPRFHLERGHNVVTG